jgi:hypothetical protein
MQLVFYGVRIFVVNFFFFFFFFSFFFYLERVYCIVKGSYCVKLD